MEDRYLDPTGVCQTLSPDDPMWICAGCDLYGTESYNDWITLNCPLQYQPLYSLPIGSPSYPDLTGEQLARLYANNLLDTYFSSGATDTFENVLHQFCDNPGINPGICQNYLQYVKCPQYSYDTMTVNESDWCGCLVLPPEEDRQVYGDDIACYPLCHQINTVQLVDRNNRPIQCNNQVCIIDDVSVSVTNSRTGDVNLTQICPGCSGNCSCIINDVEVVGADLNIDQYCGPDTQCWRTIDGELVEVPCEVASINWWIWIIIILIITIVIVVLIIAVYQAVIYSNQSEPPRQIIVRYSAAQ